MLQRRHALNKFRASVAVGDVDESILPLLEKINSFGDYYTTSSCAGRISVFQDVGSKPLDVSLGKWHRKVTAAEVVACLRPCEGVVWFLAEPPILHVACASLGAAGKMMDAARSSGFKRTGLQGVKEKRFMLEILSTERIDAPLMKDGKMLVPEKYVRFLVNLANKKHADGRKKLRRFEAKLNSI
jgi:tRNA wybutosine-synthesizing protein 3